MSTQYGHTFFVNYQETVKRVTAIALSCVLVFLLPSCLFASTWPEVKTTGAFRQQLSDDGTLLEVGCVVDDALDGPYVSLYTNNTIRSLGCFDSGKRVGHWVHYWPNGSLYSVSRFKESEKSRPHSHILNRVDLWQWFYEDGSPRASEQYSEGRLLSRNLFAANGICILHQAWDNMGKYSTVVHTSAGRDLWHGLGDLPVMFDSNRQVQQNKSVPLVFENSDAMHDWVSKIQEDITPLESGLPDVLKLLKLADGDKGNLALIHRMHVGESTPIFRDPYLWGLTRDATLHDLFRSDYIPEPRIPISVRRIDCMAGEERYGVILIMLYPSDLLLEVRSFPTFSF